jgi:hypothetical protein
MKKLTKKEIAAEQWKPWIDLLEERDGSLRELLADAHPSVVNLVAAALSVAKWHPGYEHRGWAECGLCALHFIDRMVCDECPLDAMFGNCNDQASENAWSGASGFVDVGKHSNLMYRQLLAVYAAEYDQAVIDKLEWAP